MLDGKLISTGAGGAQVKYIVYTRLFVFVSVSLYLLGPTLKNRDVTLSQKVCRVKVMIFPVVMYRCEHWTIKKAECRRIDAFVLWCGEDS